MESERAMNVGGAVPRPQRSEHGDGAVLEVLEPDQLVAAKRQPFGRSHLGRGTNVLMWGLRGYALMMVAVVIDRIVQGVAGG